MTESVEHFEISTDIGRNLVTIVARGFWDDDVLARFQAAMRAATWRLRVSSTLHILADARDFPVQSRGSAAGFGDLSTDVAQRSARVAVVVSSALARLQVARIEGSEQRRMFTTPEEALQWLFEGSL